MLIKYLSFFFCSFSAVGIATAQFTPPPSFEPITAAFRYEFSYSFATNFGPNLFDGELSSGFTAPNFFGLSSSSPGLDSAATPFIVENKIVYVKDVVSPVGGNPFTGTPPTTLGTYTTVASIANASSPNLIYTGASPANFNAILVSPSSYSRLIITSLNGPLAFNIYGNTGTTLVSGVDSSTVSAGRYLNVLQGISSLTVITGTRGTYSDFNYSLIQNVNTVGGWDLLFTYTPDTQSSLELSANRLKNIYTLQTAAIAGGLTYDCSIFDKNNICMSAGGRYDRVNTGEAKASNGLLIGAYKVNPNVRLGAWVDQNLYVNPGAGVSLSNSKPMFGLFGVWNANLSGQGLELKVAAGYGDKDLTVTRDVIATSEAGSGVSRLNTQGVSAIVSYNLLVNTNVMVSPYLGMRYTKLRAGGYTEQASDAVTTPLSYSELKQESSTALAGVKLSKKLISNFGVFAGIGAELDTTTCGNNYVGVAEGIYGLKPIVFNPTNKRLRGSANAGFFLDIDKTERISFSTAYREEAFTSTNTLSSMLTYTSGF